MLLLLLKPVMWYLINCWGADISSTYGSPRPCNSEGQTQSHDIGTLGNNVLWMCAEE